MRFISPKALWLLPGLAAFAFASCTSDDTTNGPACLDGRCLDAALADVDVPDRNTAADAAAEDAGSDATLGVDASGPDGSDAAVAIVDASDASPSVDASEAGPVDAGPYVTVATGYPAINNMLVAAGYVYFSQYSGGVGRVPVGGGAVTPFTIPSIYSASLITADATNFYFATSGGELYKVAHASTTPQRIAEQFVLGAPTQLTSDGAYVYWGEQGGRVGRVPVSAAVPSDGGGATLTIVNYASGVVASGATLYIGEHGPSNTGRIDISLGDGGVLPIATSLYATGPTNLITDGHRVYFVEGISGNLPIESVLLDGGALRRYATGAAYPRIAADGVNFYYMIGAVNGASIQKGLVDGAGTTSVAMTTLYGGLGYTSSALAVDATSLYWNDYDSGVIYKAPK